MRKIPMHLLIIFLLILTCGCSESPPALPTVTPATPTPVIPITLPPSLITPTRTTSVSENTITIVKNTFMPANMTVKVGSTVRWYTRDDHPHNIEFTDKAFSTSTFLLVPSKPTFSQRFLRAGTYDFACLIHPEMQGTITVEE